MALTPGEMLKLRQIATVNPANQSESWQTLSEAQTKIAQTRTERLGLTVSIFPDATATAIQEAPPGFYAPAAAKIVLDGNLIPVEPDSLEITTNPDHLKAFSALHGVLIHECGHANHSVEQPDFEGETEQVAMATTLLEEIRMEAKVIERRPDDAKWLRCSAKDIILGEGKVEGDMGALSSQVLVLGRVAAGSLERSDVAGIEKKIKEIVGDDVFKKIDSINKKAVKVSDGDFDSLLSLGRELAELFPKEEGGYPLSPEDIEEIKDALDKAGSGGEGKEELEDILADAEARGKVKQAIAEISERTAGAASGSLPESGERYPTDEERRARNDLFLKFREVRWRDRHLVERSSSLPPGRLNSRSALQRSAEKSLGQMPQSKPWRQKKRCQEEMPRLSLGVLIDTSGSMQNAAHALSGSLWALSHAAHDTGGKVAAALFGNGYELLWGAHSAPPRHVTEMNPYGGTDNVAETVGLLDDALSWGEDLGPRLLVVVSDGWWMNQKASDEAIAEIRSRGVKVIQVGVSMTPQDHGANEIVTIDKASDLAMTVGNIAIRELRSY